MKKDKIRCFNNKFEDINEKISVETKHLAKRLKKTSGYIL